MPLGRLPTSYESGIGRAHPRTGGEGVCRRDRAARERIEARLRNAARLEAWSEQLSIAASELMGMVVDLRARRGEDHNSVQQFGEGGHRERRES
jgi:hypothetical protein